MVKLEKNSIHTVTIQGYSSDGMGVARIDNMVVFVKGAVRGETCKVKLVKVLKNMCFAIIDEIISPSPERLAPDCGDFRLCGGCDFRHVTYAEECILKRERVDDALKRVGGLTLSVSEFHPSEEMYRYRNKAQYFFSGGDSLKVGFFRSGSHDVVDVCSCAIQDERADRCRGALKNWMEKYGVAPYDERENTGAVRYLQVRTGDGGTLVTLVSAKKSLPREKELAQELINACPDLRGVVLNLNSDRGNVIMGGVDRIIWGEGFVTDTLCGLVFRISPHSFYQINRPQAEKLYGKALELLSPRGDEKIVDLYCGIGTIGLSMAGSVGSVLGVEVVPQAIEDAKENARRNGITNAEFICGDAGKAAARLAEKGERPDAVIVDPPRKGLSTDVIDAIHTMQPEKVVYISCDPATLARDLKLLCADGSYTAVTAEAYDLFPRCAHVETVVLMSRK